jgi:hypothetical protein
MERMDWLMEHLTATEHSMWQFDDYLSPPSNRPRSAYDTWDTVEDYPLNGVLGDQDGPIYDISHFNSDDSDFDDMPALIPASPPYSEEEDFVLAAAPFSAPIAQLPVQAPVTSATVDIPVESDIPDITWGIPQETTLAEATSASASPFSTFLNGVRSTVHVPRHGISRYTLEVLLPDSEYYEYDDLDEWHATHTLADEYIGRYGVPIPYSVVTSALAFANDRREENRTLLGKRVRLEAFEDSDEDSSLSGMTDVHRRAHAGHTPIPARAPVCPFTDFPPTLLDDDDNSDSESDDPGLA